MRFFRVRKEWNTREREYLCVRSSFSRTTLCCSTATSLVRLTRLTGIRNQNERTKDEMRRGEKEKAGGMKVARTRVQIISQIEEVRQSESESEASSASHLVREERRDEKKMRIRFTNNSNLCSIHT